MNFQINKNATLPTLKMELILEKATKFERVCPTDGCSKIISYSRKDSFVSATKRNTLCAKCNRQKRGPINVKFTSNEILNKVLVIYYDKRKTLKDIAKECDIKFDTLNKIIEFNNLPKIKRIRKTIDKEHMAKAMYETKYGGNYGDYLIKKPEFLKYKGRVKYYTNKTIKHWGGLIKDIEKVGTGENSYHIDHIVSIKDCFLYKIEPEIVADIINLRAIPKLENLSKGSTSLFSPEILLLNVMESKNNKIKVSEIYGFFYK